MANKSLAIVEEEYQMKYGDIPDTEEEILLYLESVYPLDMNKIAMEEKRIDALQWAEVSFIMPIIPKPSPRPRYSFKTDHFYVMGAAQNKKIIKKFVNQNHIIYTRTDLYIETYQPTPLSSMTKNEIYLAEKKKICPMQNPD